MSLRKNLLCVLFILCLILSARSQCVFENGKYNLSALDRPTPWLVPGANDTQHYEISLCHAKSNVSSGGSTSCQDSAVCQITGGSSISFGNALQVKDDERSHVFADFKGDGFSVYLTTKTRCRDSQTGSDSSYRASIYFSCGPNLGSPEVMLFSSCQVNFYWKTFVACPVSPPKHQVPCYAIGSDGIKRDLSHLIRDTGGHLVKTNEPGTQFYINVCSDITPDNQTQHCDGGSPMCSVQADKVVNVGSLEGGVVFHNGLLVLTYASRPEDFEKCPRGTRVVFRCPEKGKSSPPMLLPNGVCPEQVLWETEFACPESFLKGDFKSCRFTNDANGVELDLSPLQSDNISLKDENGTQVSMSICSGLPGCGDSKSSVNSVCRNNTDVLGTTKGVKFLHADNEVRLVYQGIPSKDCQNPSTTILFRCNRTAETGVPKRVFSDGCQYVFEWDTEHACPKTTLDLPCWVMGPQNYIVYLHDLQLTDGKVWIAEDRRQKPRDGETFFLNVCATLNSDVGNCSDSAACLKIGGDFKSLGHYNKAPFYDTLSGRARIHYTGGSPCPNGKKWSSTIDFVCKPGLFTAEPILVFVDEESCTYRFEWHISNGCPAGVTPGQDCKIIDSSQGLNFDLSPLKSQTFNVSTPKFEYYLGVCDEIHDSPCSANRSTNESIGGCQKEIGGDSFMIGKADSSLTYLDGVVVLKYHSGDVVKTGVERNTFILFICDETQLENKLTLVDDSDWLYIFHFYTSLVCQHRSPSKCVVTDPTSGALYDFSVLSESGRNWEANFKIEKDGKEEEMQVLVNICQPLINAPESCDTTASVCMTNSKGKAVISNLGHLVSPPKIAEEGRLIATYEGGSPCVSYGLNTTYSTVIHFSCDSDHVTNGPRFLNKVGECEFAFLWSTTAACPTRSPEEGKGCRLTDQDSGFTFDLTTLARAKEPYSVQVPAGKFLLNICQDVNQGCGESGAKVCQVDVTSSHKIQNIVSGSNYSLEYFPGQDLTLVYRASAAGQSDVLITFPCDNASTEEQIRFVTFEDNRYHFSMPTSLTCIPPPSQCTFEDGLDSYDLSPLSRHAGSNYDASDGDHIFHINFCRPLLPSDRYTCPGGATAACRTHRHQQEKAISIGSEMQIHIHRPGKIFVEFTNGTISVDSPPFQSSTSVLLTCSPTQGELSFITSSPDGAFFFSMNTPAACPLKKAEGAGCLVKEPLFGYTFDLNPLKRKNNNYNLTVGDYRYEFNVCDKLSSSQGSCTNSSACQLKPSDPAFSKSLGLPSEKLQYNDGVISLEYLSGTDSCHGMYERSTKISFTCHHAMEDKDGPIFISEAENCSYLFQWPTIHACPPFDIMECSAEDNDGNVLDLSELSLANDNYYVKNALDEKVNFVINVCRSVVHGPNSRCPYTAGACLLEEGMEPISLGRVNRGPYIDEGIIKMDYTLGDPCLSPGTQTARFYKTEISFFCDPEGRNREPQFLGSDDCTYMFEWYTAHVCLHETVQPTDDCTVMDPATDFLYNLTALRDHGPFEVMAKGYRFHLQVCQGKNATPCIPGTGICQEELSGERRNFSLGVESSRLLLRQGQLQLNLSSGDFCHGSRFKRASVITFSCGVGIGQPEFVTERDDCTYIFEWQTELACQRTVHCEINNGSHHLDLTALSGKYHMASSLLNDGAEYFVSVCGPLPDIPGTFCPPNSAICKQTRDRKTGIFLYENLGQVEFSPIYDFENKPSMLYVNGSECSADSSLTNRAKITLLCDSFAGMGEPVLLEVLENGCLYFFEWRTSIVCPSEPEKENFTSCEYVDKSKGIHIDLSSLREPENPYRVTDNKDGTVFHLGVCSTLKRLDIDECKNASVCGVSGKGNVTKSYGAAVSQKFSYMGAGRLRLFLEGGDDCPSGENGRMSTEILFICDINAGHGEPVLHNKYTCHVGFIWKTSLVCQNSQQQCNFETRDMSYDFNILTSLTHNWNTTDKDDNIYWIHMCRGIVTNPDTLGCPNTAAVCMRNPAGTFYNLGNVQSIQYKQFNATDLILTFNSSDERACRHLPNTLPVSRIFMRCGKTIGGPVIFSGPDSECFYDFVWKSSLACSNKVEVLMLEKNGVIRDERFNLEFDIKPILNKTFAALGSSSGDVYNYEINLNGLQKNLSEPPNACSHAAICQKKAGSTFVRDIGTLSTREFIIRGEELHLQFQSLTKACGKNNSKNVTTIITMICSMSAGVGNPTFWYESGDCDYLFQWDTNVVCPVYVGQWDHNADDIKEDPVHPNAFKDVQSSHTTEIILGVLVAGILVTMIVFIIVKPDRRARVAHRLRGFFGPVSLPYFRYRRTRGERLVLVDASQPHHDDEADVEMLS